MTLTVDLQIHRTLPAPAARVFQAWTAPTDFARWWWPPRFQTRVEMELEAGGRYRVRSTALGEGNDIEVSGQFRIVEPPDRLAYTWMWRGEDRETLVDVRFVDAGDETQLELSHSGFRDGPERDNHVQGWNDCIDRLVAYLHDARSIPAKKRP